MAWTRKQLLPLEIERYTDASHDDPGPDAFVVSIVNNCMSPDGIFEGDKVVCDPSKPYNPGSIVIAEVAGEDVPVIGRYRLRRSRTGNLITEISPSNDAFPQHFIDAERPGSVVGRVVEHRKKL